MSVAMQVSVEKTGQHERKLTVSIPAERVEGEIGKRLQGLAQTARIPGFRKGKIPLAVIAKQYGEGARAEVVGMLIDSTLSDAIRQEQLVPASRPHVDIIKNDPLLGLEYHAVFEVYPEIVVKGLDKVVVDKPLVQVSDEDIQEVLERISKQHMDWTVVDRASAEDDRVTVDMKGTLIGEEKPFTEAPDMKVRIGAGEMIPGFEDNLKGMKAGKSSSFELGFPLDYFSPELAGKTARFDVKVTSVEEGSMPVIDDTLAEKLGVKEGGLEELKKRIKAGLQTEADQLLHNYVKEQLLDHLLGANTVDVPQGLINTELNVLQQNPEAAALNKELSLEDNAKRRVTLSLLLGQYIKDQAIKIDQAKVQQMIREMAMSYPNPEAVMKWFYQDQQRLSGVASMVLEDQAVDHILSGVQHSEETLSYKQMLEKSKGDK
jgi:trigger factor